MPESKDWGGPGDTFFWRVRALLNCGSIMSRLKLCNIVSALRVYSLIRQDVVNIAMEFKE
jgi:hypothetical protein